ncbi:STT3 domain-containing protein [Methanonatronarchaeum sp. AMET-Sl]|uniref:STT3 domain-containing protein n=1 Tax=Methanonatronarchaeum sp. AMET-Sl TaxID=3037654 RepID=UPI00244DDF12|nr:STT3 domain-containing protein [Methanonatronarchaeum sp. AMET-Sl]WGI17543.1 STT3 domain-containing protein [Methanonatronarchaeum sp. AMET-Sl]
MADDSKKEKTFQQKLADGDYTRKISIVTVLFAIVVGTWMRISMGTLDRLQKFDPFQHYLLSEYWYENWAYATHDLMMYPGPDGALRGVGYPPLTHAVPAIITEITSFFTSITVLDVVILGPVIFTALIPLVYWGLGTELYNEKVGIVAALLTLVFPHFIEVGRAGAYDTNPHIALFYPLILLLLVKSFRQNTIRGRVQWGLGAGVTMGLFGLFWAGFNSIFAYTAFAIAIYVLIGSWLDKVKPEDSYSLLGILVAYPIISYFHTLSFPGEETLLVAPLVVLPYIAAKLPDWSEKLNYVSNGIKFRNYVATSIVGIVFAGALLVWYGILPISVSGFGLISGEGVWGTVAELQPTFGTGFEAGLTPLYNHFGHWGTFLLPLVFIGPILYTGYKIYSDFRTERVFEFTFLLLTFIMIFWAHRFLPLYLYFVPPVAAAMIVGFVEFIGLKDIKREMSRSWGEIKNWDILKVSAIVVFVVMISFMSLPLADGGVQQYPSTIYHENNGAWISTFDHMDESEDFTPDEHVMTWWDYGFPLKALGDVGAFTDNTQWNVDDAAAFYMSKDIEEAHEMLVEWSEDRDEEVDYIVGNKGLGILVPGTMYGGKTSAVATVADVNPSDYVDDWPEGQDDISQQVPWSVVWQEGMAEPNVPEPLQNTVYYDLAFPEGVTPGDDEPEVGDVLYDKFEVVYKSPEVIGGPFDGNAIIVYEVIYD